MKSNGYIIIRAVVRLSVVGLALLKWPTFRSDLLLIAGPCDAQPCSNGECVLAPASPTGYQCNCHPGYSGPNCDIGNVAPVRVCVCLCMYVRWADRQAACYRVLYCYP